MVLTIITICLHCNRIPAYACRSHSCMLSEVSESVHFPLFPCFVRRWPPAQSREYNEAHSLFGPFILFPPAYTGRRCDGQNGGERMSLKMRV